MSDNTTRAGAGGHLGAATMARLGAEVSRADFWIFVVLLVLAISGAALSQLEDRGGRFYWSALVLIYAAASIGRSWLQARGEGASAWGMIRSQVLHWLGALAAIQIVLLFDYEGITDRGPAADYSLLLLALSTFLAGVHFNWTFLLLGSILAVIAVALGFLDQLSIFLVTVPLAVLAIWIVYRRKFG
jgi:hypothetical protein